MSDESSRAAIRFSFVVGAIVGLYLTAVNSFGVLHGFGNVLHFGPGAALLEKACIFSATMALVAYLTRVLLVSAGRSPFALIAGDFRKIVTVDSAITTATISLGLAGTLIAFTPMKRMIADVRGFPLDHALAGLDHHLFGMDAWRLTDPVFGSPFMMELLQICYSLWFSFMWSSIIFCVLMGPKVLRWRYSIAFFLCWILVGSLAAYFLASAGPCFYAAAFHDGHFSDLMDHLRSSDAALRQISPNLGLQSLDLQNMLWDGFVKHKDEFGLGISSMPSLHVTTSCLMALAAYHISRPVGRAVTAFAVIIWIGSIQLGWHYGVDGIVGAAMAIAIWQLAGVITTRFILREAGTAPLVIPDGEAVPAR